MQSRSNRRQAIVIGGSVAGLLAARVLADYFQSVIIIDRDDLSSDGGPRRGVPQGRHAHALLAGGQRAIEELLPGISKQLVELGAIEADALKDGTWFFEGAGFRRSASGVRGLLVSRPGLEAMIRKRVRSLPNIELLGRQSVRGLITSSSDNSRVLGVQLDDRSIGADLVVDATGRGSQSSAWLESIGYEAPSEDVVGIQLAYTTRKFRYSPNVLGDNKFIVIAPTADGKCGGVAALQEGDDFIVSLFGHFGEKAPAELDGFVNFAKRLPSPLIYNAIRNADPVDDAATFNFPANRRRRYELLRQFPTGYLVFGDSLCSFDPIYGQGMSVAALEALELRSTLQDGATEVARRFFSRAARIIDNPWQIAVGNDLRMPETLGKRGLAVRLVNGYISRVHKRAQVDPNIGTAFLRVAQLLETPLALFKPKVLLNVLCGDLLGRGPAERAADESLFTTAEPRSSSAQ